MIRQNLHNHTLFSDGGFLPEEIISAAIRAGLDQIGISDHFFTTKIYDDISYRKWQAEFWPRYLYSLERLEEYFAPQIRVLKGVEVDSCFSRSVGSLELLPWNDFNERLDYVMLEYVGESGPGGMAVEQLIQVRELSRIPVILVHPHLQMIARNIELVRFFAFLREHEVAIEIVSGERNRWFWDRFDAELLRGCRLSIGTDTHGEISEVGNIGRALDFIAENRLENQQLQFLKADGPES